MVDHQDAVERASDVQFDPVDPERHRRRKGRECVFALVDVQSAVREDVNHLSSLCSATGITWTSYRLFTNHALVIRLQIR